MYQKISPILARFGAVAGDSISIRTAHGKLSGLISTIVNLILAIVKMGVGIIFSSVALTADGFNNLSDTGSSVVSFVSFKISAMPADREHPYGHARVEYLASIIVAVMILLLGLESLGSSLGALISPVYREPSVLEFIALGSSILVKIALGIYNRRVGKRIDSELLLAVAHDSFSDVLSSLAVLISAFIQLNFGIVLDGMAGILVSVLIIISGINVVRGALDKILGEPPTREFVDKIEGFVLGYDGILGVHDLIIHDYGPGRCFVSIHAEVAADINLTDGHDLMDKIERDAMRILSIQMVLHMDPIQTDCKFIEPATKLINFTLQDLDSRLSFHDLRIVEGKQGCNFIFDVIVPFECVISKRDILRELENAINTHYENSHLVVTFDIDYVR